MNGLSAFHTCEDKLPSALYCPRVQLRSTTPNPNCTGLVGGDESSCNKCKLYSGTPLLIGNLERGQALGVAGLHALAQVCDFFMRL